MNLVTELHCFKHFFFTYTDFVFAESLDRLPHLRPHRHVHPAQRSRVARPVTGPPRFAGKRTGVVQEEVVVATVLRSFSRGPWASPEFEQFRATGL